MHTKLKGDIGQLIVAQVLLMKGWHVAFPYGENLKYDLIVEKDNLMKRIQVKTITPIIAPKNAQKTGIHFAKDFIDIC